MTTQAPSATILTAADHEHFLEHGYVVLRAAVPLEIIEPAARLLDEKPQSDHGSPVTPQDRDLIDACTTDRVLDAAAELFGPDYPILRHRTGATPMSRTYDPTDADTWSVDGWGGAHYDQDYATLIADAAAVRAFIFLTKVRHRGGAFLYAPGSQYWYRALMQRGPTALVWGQGRWAQASTGHLAYPPPRLEEFLAEPGDVLFWHLHMGHSGSANVADPQTRHALSIAFVSRRRIDPGDKSFEEMSTIERSTSIRWLRHRFGPQFVTYPVPHDAGASQALAEGFGGPAEVVAHAEARFGGKQHRWYVSADNPSLIHHATAEDWVGWSEGEPVRLECSAVASLHHLALQSDVFLTVTTPDGMVVLRTEDYETWTPVSELEGVTGTSLFYTNHDTSSIAQGMHVFAPDPSAPHQVLRLSGGDDNSWLTGGGTGDLAAWTDRAVVATAPAPVVGVTVCDLAGRGFAMVLDLEGDGPYYLRGTDGAAYDGDAHRLSFDAPTPPRAIRIYERARHYWLVTYQREGRIFWGAIDWDDDPPVLRELSASAALERALQLVGLV